MGDLDRPKKPTKRKRVDSMMTLEQRDARIGALREEIEGLIKYYNEGFDQLKIGSDSVKGSNSMIACLLEESNLPLSKLVESIFVSVKEKDGSMTVGLVKNIVIGIGQRCLYGVKNVNADVLEDESFSCLWCWEV